MTYSYITTGGMKPHIKAHYIHSIKLYDNELEEEEEQVSKYVKAKTALPEVIGEGHPTLWTLYNKYFERFARK